MDVNLEFENLNKASIGKSEICYKEVSSILTRASGFMNLYDYTLNPYSGCSFGCTYCYAAFFSRTKEQRKNWGAWIEVKKNAVELLKKIRAKPLTGKTIYMSSVTDPYQPIEKDLEITRNLLQELVDFHQPRLVVQTRSPLVTRDIDLFKKFRDIQINMTITTDSEAIRKVFEPFCPSTANRLRAIQTINEEGIDSCITMTPLLPVENIDNFVNDLKATGVRKFTVQPFHVERGKFIAGTREAAMDLLKRFDWTDEKYRAIEDRLIEHFPEIGIGKNGFKPI